MTINTLSEDHDLNIRVITEFGLQALVNDSSTEYNIFDYPSYLTIDGHQGGTFVYGGKHTLEELLVTYTAQVWNVVVGNHHFILGFVSNVDVFNNPDYIEIRDRFINSTKLNGTSNA